MLSVGFRKVSTEKNCQYEKSCPPKKVSQEAWLLSADDQPSCGGNTTISIYAGRELEFRLPVLVAR